MGFHSRMRRVQTSQLLVVVFFVCSWLCLLIVEEQSTVSDIGQLEEVRLAGRPVGTAEATIARVIQYIKEVPHESCHSVAFYGDHVSRDGWDDQLPVCTDEGLRPPAGRCIIYSLYQDDKRSPSFLKSVAHLHCRVFFFNYRPKLKLLVSNATIQSVSLMKRRSGREIRARLVGNLEAIREVLDQADSFVDYLSIDLRLDDSLVIIRDLVLNGMLRNVKQLAVRIDLDTFAQTLANYRRLYQSLRRLEDRRFYRFNVQTLETSYGYRKAVKRYEYSIYRLTWLNVIYQQPL